VWLVLVLTLSLYSSARRPIIYFGLIIGVGLAGGLFCSLIQVDYRTELAGFVNKKIVFRAEIVDEPDERETLTKLVVRPDNYHTKILVTAERYPQYRLGDVVSVQGKIALPKNIFSATGTPFDYQTYLAKDGVYYEMYKPQISLFSRPVFGPLIWLANLKSHLLAIMNNILPEPESSLLAGILLGAKKGMGTAITNNFKLAGVSHILVLSGYNITFVALVLLRACALLPRFIGGVAGFVSIIAFGLLAGGGSVVWRAVLMSLIALYAKLTGRIFDVTAGILFSAVALVAYNPATLTADLGFQLSIMAMIGIVYVAPMLEEKVFYRISERFGLREIVSTTFGAQLAVLPLLWQATGQVSVIGFVSNLIILPLVPTAMTFGAIAVLLGFFSTFIAWPVSFITYLLLKTILVLVNLFAHLPLAGLVITSGSWWVVGFIYVLIFGPVATYWYKISKNI
jgi:competence protein ComEC